MFNPGSTAFSNFPTFPIPTTDETNPHRITNNSNHSLEVYDARGGSQTTPEVHMNANVFADATSLEFPQYHAYLETQVKSNTGNEVTRLQSASTCSFGVGFVGLQESVNCDLSVESDVGVGVGGFDDWFLFGSSHGHVIGDVLESSLEWTARRAPSPFKDTFIISQNSHLATPLSSPSPQRDLRNHSRVDSVFDFNNVTNSSTSVVPLELQEEITSMTLRVTKSRRSEVPAVETTTLQLPEPVPSDSDHGFGVGNVCQIYQPSQQVKYVENGSWIECSCLNVVESGTCFDGNKVLNDGSSCHLTTSFAPPATCPHVTLIQDHNNIISSSSDPSAMFSMLDTSTSTRKLQAGNQYLRVARNGFLESPRGFLVSPTTPLSNSMLAAYPTLPDTPPTSAISSSSPIDKSLTGDHETGSDHAEFLSTSTHSQLLHVPWHMLNSQNSPNALAPSDASQTGSLHDIYSGLCHDADTNHAAQPQQLSHVPWSMLNASTSINNQMFHTMNTEVNSWEQSMDATSCSGIKLSTNVTSVSLFDIASREEVMAVSDADSDLTDISGVSHSTAAWSLVPVASTVGSDDERFNEVNGDGHASESGIQNQQQH
ncbi:hypothetical protein HDU76_001185, partial [Blyttiomyces sp. JEL0837]